MIILIITIIRKDAKGKQDKRQPKMVDVLRETGLKKVEEDGILLKMAIAIVEPIEQFYSLTGAQQPWQRFLLGTALTGVVMWLAEPDFAFYNGKPREFTPIAMDRRTSTVFHWTIPSIAVGLASAIFI